jgi:hypothetical protein
MRPLLLSAALAALILACSPPAQREAEAPSSAQAPQVQACNAIQPDFSKLVSVQEEEAVGVAASDLRGGRIAPGVYDLMRAVRLGQATGWQGARAVALDVRENAEGGVILNWAGAAPGGAVDSWTATFTDATPDARLTYTCGRIGEVEASFTATADALQLSIPDGANGSLELTFARRN